MKKMWWIALKMTWQICKDSALPLLIILLIVLFAFVATSVDKEIIDRVGKIITWGFIFVAVVFFVHRLWVYGVGLYKEFVRQWSEK